jgi:ribosomal subunit interface protein
MKVQPQVVFHGMEPSPAVEARAREKVAMLERFCHDVVACRVSVDQLQKHKHQGRPFGVRIDLTIPGHEVVVDRVEHEDVYVALRDAFDDMKRRLAATVERRSDRQRAHAAARGREREGGRESE